MKMATWMRSGGSGFTLIELMIALAVVALLAAVALPAYTEHVNKGKRAEGQAALMAAIQLQERAYTANGTYTGNANFPTLFGLAATATVYSGQDPGLDLTGRYTLSVVADAANNCNVLTECVTIQAAPVLPFRDDNCGTLTLNTRGLRTESGARDTAYCWR